MHSQYGLIFKTSIYMHFPETNLLCKVMLTCITKKGKNMFKKSGSIVYRVYSSLILIINSPAAFTNTSRDGDATGCLRGGSIMLIHN